MSGACSVGGAQACQCGVSRKANKRGIRELRLCTVPLCLRCDVIYSELQPVSHAPTLSVSGLSSVSRRL